MTNLYAPILDASKIVTLDAIAEDEGPPGGAVGTLVSGLVDLNPPASGANNVTDADSGSATGLATVEDLLASAQVAQVGADVAIAHDANDTLTLQNVSLTTLRAHTDDFRFV